MKNGRQQAAGVSPHLAGIGARAGVAWGRPAAPQRASLTIDTSTAERDPEWSIVPLMANALKLAVVLPLLLVAVFSQLAVLIAAALVLLAAAAWRRLAVSHSRALEGHLTGEPLGDQGRR